jgi:nucleoside-diphosphate-sugar epimerase
VLGASGFIGRHMSDYLRRNGVEVETPQRGADNLQGRKLGHVIYAIGLTGNFRQSPDAAVEAHVCTLRRLMDGADYESWLYLSSTRVYGSLGKTEQAKEDAVLPVTPGGDGLYDLSKLLGESICLANANPAVRVARLSNVYGVGQGEHTFLGEVMAEAAASGRVLFREAPQSSKDYVSIDDVLPLLHGIAVSGRHRLYNVASGVPVTHGQLAASFAKYGLTAEFAEDAPVRTFPVIDTNRLREEFGAVSHSLLEDLPILVDAAGQGPKRPRQEKDLGR